VDNLAKENVVAIKKVDGENFDAFLGLIDKLAEYEKLAPPDRAARQRLRQDCLADKPKYQAFLGKAGNQYVSYVIYFFTYSSFLAQPTLFLEDIFVLEEHRGNGVGEKMFGFIKETAKREGCGRIEFTVLKWNKSAQEFYHKNGGKCLDDWFFYRVVSADF
jgi:GNAT superfamily N-acetyltransferase